MMQRNRMLIQAQNANKMIKLKSIKNIRLK